MRFEQAYSDGEPLCFWSEELNVFDVSLIVAMIELERHYFIVDLDCFEPIPSRQGFHFPKSVTGDGPWKAGHFDIDYARNQAGGVEQLRLMEEIGDRPSRETIEERLRAVYG